MTVNFGPTATLAVVDTSQVGANAASQIVTATRASTSSYSFKTSAVATNDLTASITTSGYAVGIDFTGQIQVGVNGGNASNFASPMQVYITRDGTQIGTAYVDVYDYVSNTTPSGAPVLLWSFQATLTVVDTPAAGSHTYAIYLSVAACGTAPTTAVIGTVNPVLKVREYKR